MPIALLTALGSLIPQALELFAGDHPKLERIGGYVSLAIQKVPGYAEAVIDLFGHGDGRKYTTSDFDALLARIDAEDARSTALNQAAHAREDSKID